VSSAAAAIPDPRFAGMSERQRTVVFLVMAVGMFMALLDIQIVASSLVEIQGGLAATSAEISGIQTYYLIAEVIMIPLSGWFARTLSTRWLFTLSAGGFTAASIACALAWNIQSMILFRAAQGFLGGAMIPTAFATGFVMFPGEKQARVTAILGLVATLAPTLGPTVGGYITDHLSWRWLFFVNVAPGLLIMAVVPRMLHVDLPNLGLLRQLDYLGLVTLAVFLGGLEYVLDEGPRNAWFSDRFLLVLICASMVCSVIFVWSSLVTKSPMVDLRTFANRNFALGCTLSFIIGVGLYGSICMGPLYFQLIRGYDALQVGMTVFVAGVFQILATPCTVLLSKKVDLRLLLAFGFTLFAASQVMMMHISSQWGFWEFFLPQALRGFAAMFCIVPATNLSLGGLAPQQLGGASGLYNLMRNLGGAIGLSFLNTQLFYDRLAFHYDALTANLNRGSRDIAAAIDGMAEHLSPYIVDAGRARLAGGHVLSGLVQREALTLSFADVFLLIAAAFILGLLAVPWIRKVDASHVALGE
jgi:DHA2 family multidrug resistance protein